MMSDKITVQLTEAEHKVFLKFQAEEARKENEKEIAKSEKKIESLEAKLADEKANLKALKAK
ncbi:hypothetical protein HUE88_03425 [Candidatus Sulfurimonas baltica]|uniref:Uncharacterized protein n=2 Tax=Candidatus Sulfurimonas baltica TaxID=2740404 RepID=A0A7S7LWD3_9BACT|nr:hypothetical protein HUE88_03425 [Candidatus Sulfurimonas baltica]